MKLVHGGDWAGYRAEFGRDALDFSANVSPLGLPHGVAAAISAALPMADRYPDPLCRELRAALAAAEGVPIEHILCGSGAADLIFRLVLAVQPRRALLPAPTFAEYAAALDMVGCMVDRFLLDEANDFAVTETCTNICRGEQRSPMLRNCCKFSIVGDGALDVPFRGTARFEFITMLCRRAVWRILRRYPEDVIG